MYLKEFSIDHVKCFDEGVGLIQCGKGRSQALKVILVENGTGKAHPSGDRGRAYGS